MSEHRSARILVVDDDTRNIRLLEAMLHAQGHETLAATCGGDALRLAASENPDLILLDVMMPDMNGFEVLEKLKAAVATAGIPVIMVTSLDDRESRMYALQAGADEFLCKPVDRAELSVRVRNILSLRECRQRQEKQDGAGA